jgi:hypothetical protein
MAGVVGGTASELGGGKFSNGAVTGAFVHMFNAEMDPRLKGKGVPQAMDGDGRGSPEDAAIVAQTEADMRSGLVRGLKATSSVSSFAALAAGSTGQEYAAGLFVVTGYISDYSLLYMGELPPQTMFNNLYLDTAMFELTNRYPLSGGLMNIGAKTLVNQ